MFLYGSYIDVYRFFCVVLCRMSESRRPRYWEPEPRFGACSATVGRKLYMWGGRLRAGVFAPMNTVCILEMGTSLWTEQHLSGPCPPGVAFAACASIGHCIYAFGGFTENGYSNSIYKLETITLKFSNVKATNAEMSPIPKFRCGMIAINKYTLFIACGYGGPTLQHSTGVFIKDPNDRAVGWTNEVHCFTLDEEGRRWCFVCVQGYACACMVHTHTQVVHILNCILTYYHSTCDTL